MRRVGQAALVAAAFGAPAQAQLRPSAPQAIAAAAADCWQAVGPIAVDEAKLGAQGWRAGSVSNRGKAVPTPLRFYGKQDSNVVLILLNAPGMSSCSVTSSVRTAADVATSAQLLMNRLKTIDPNVKSTRRDQSIIFLSLPRVATVDLTGNARKPAIRISVGFTSPEKK